MIFTDKFVYVHEPKTGGTFVTSALLRLYGIRWQRWTHLINTIKRELVYDTPHGRFVYHNNKHGTCREIPAVERDKKIVATIRNPYDLLVSQYEFGWWRRREFFEYYRRVPNFNRRYANFPALDFAQFVALMNEAFGAVGADGELGWCTARFVNYYFADPSETLAKLGNDHTAPDDFRAGMFNVHFIRTDELNRGLHDFLLAAGFDQSDVRFILDLKRVLPGGKGRSREQQWEKYYTPQLKQAVRRAERHLFTIFPEFDQ